MTAVVIPHGASSCGRCFSCFGNAVVSLRKRRMPRHHHLKADTRFVFCKKKGIETWMCVSHTTSTCIVQELRDKDTLTVVHLHEPSRAQSDSFQNADFLAWPNSSSGFTEHWSVHCSFTMQLLTTTVNATCLASCAHKADLSILGVRAPNAVILFDNQHPSGNRSWKVRLRRDDV
jgi:hypothetical protein